jgi:hypothetical protein
VLSCMLAMREPFWARSAALFEAITVMVVVLFPLRRSVTARLGYDPGNDGVRASFRIGRKVFSYQHVNHGR